MFSKSAEYYDEIYNSQGKDYTKEALKTHKVIQKYLKSHGRSLLDVGCGTGYHIDLLNQYYAIEGLDLDRNMLAVAQKKHPKTRFYHKDMVDFKINKKYDVIISLFSSIGYVRTKQNLNKALQTMFEHLVSGGVLLIEPWFSPEQWSSDNVFTVHVNKPDLKITRMSYGSRKRKVSTLEFHYLIGTSKGIKHHTETHQLGLFDKDEYLEAFHKAGLKVTYDAKGLDGRGLYIGTKPLDKK